MAESRKAFISAIWPLWSAEIPAEQVISTEDSGHRLEREADLSGTDAFVARRRTGILVPFASRVEFYHPDKNNPFLPKYFDHYPRFTVRLAKARRDGTMVLDVECAKRLAALDDPISTRYLPLYTFQSLVVRKGTAFEVLQTSCVSTLDLFQYIKERNLGDLAVGNPSFTRPEGDAYRIVTVAKLRRAGIKVWAKDFR